VRRQAHLRLSAHYHLLRLSAPKRLPPEVSELLHDFEPLRARQQIQLRWLSPWFERARASTARCRVQRFPLQLVQWGSPADPFRMPVRALGPSFPWVPHPSRVLCGRVGSTPRHASLPRRRTGYQRPGNCSAHRNADRRDREVCVRLCSSSCAFLLTEAMEYRFLRLRCARRRNDKVPARRLQSHGAPPWRTERAKDGAPACIGSFRVLGLRPEP
jgi:hypothetical protein